jgi:hypothetical protein
VSPTSVSPARIPSPSSRRGPYRATVRVLHDTMEIWNLYRIRTASMRRRVCSGLGHCSSVMDSDGGHVTDSRRRRAAASRLDLHSTARCIRCSRSTRPHIMPMSLTQSQACTSNMPVSEQSLSLLHRNGWRACAYAIHTHTEQTIVAMC